MNHGLFAIDSLAAVHGVDGYPRMPLVAGRNNHRVNILPDKKLTIIAGRVDLLPVLFLCPDKSAVVQVAYSNQFNTRNLKSGVSVGMAHDAHPDGCNPDFVVLTDLRRPRNFNRPCIINSQCLKSSGGQKKR